MSEIRIDPITRTKVIIAREQAKRPNDFFGTRSPEIPKAKGFCPFCPGNETTMPPEVYAVREGFTSPNELGWQVRVVPHKFPVLRPDMGAHEVVIETPQHHARQSGYSYEQVCILLESFRKRMELLSRRFPGVIIFHNCGRQAGSSFVHPLSQIIAMDSLPQIQMEVEGVDAWSSRERSCPYCQMIEDANKQGRVILQNDSFVVLAPYASRFPFETWLLPLEHVSSFTNVANMPDLAKAFRDNLQCLDSVLRYPDYNWLIHSSQEAECFHWHFEFFPRLVPLAALGLGSGIFINWMPPEEAAQYLRFASVEPCL